MDQFIVTLEPGADKTILKKMIQNLKGIGKVILQKDVEVKTAVKTRKKTDKITEDWIREMKELSDNFDSSLVDLNDDKTRYILKI